MAQLIVTMKRHLVRAYAQDREMPDLSAAMAAAPSARKMGDPGFSMRFLVDGAEEAAFRAALAGDWSVEDDYALRSF